MSVFDQCRSALKAAKEPLTCAEILDLCDEALDTTQIAQAMFAMTKSEEALREGERGAFRYSINPDYTPTRKRPGETEAPAPKGKKAKPSKTARAPKAPKRGRPSKLLRIVAKYVGNGAGDKPPEPPAPATDFGVGINDAGHLGISKGPTRIELDPAEFERLRSFIEKAETVWSAA
jgi:hypothetical protein